MAKKKQTPTKTHWHRITDTVVAMGLVALSAELAVIAFVGSGLQASIYNPLPLHKASGENQFTQKVDTSSIKAPVSKSFTACERRAKRVRNQKRQDQILVLCHAREKNKQGQE
jgi:hypothetical protein